MYRFNRPRLNPPKGVNEYDFDKKENNFLSNEDKQLYQLGYENGYQQGYKQGKQDSDTSADYDRGYDFGYQHGFKSGKESGLVQATQNLTNQYEEQLKQAKTQYYDSGKQDGYNEGYQKGKQDGYSNGYNLGYSDGYTFGKQDGLKEGYEKKFSSFYAYLFDQNNNQQFRIALESTYFKPLDYGVYVVLDYREAAVFITKNGNMYQFLFFENFNNYNEGRSINLSIALDLEFCYYTKFQDTILTGRDYFGYLGIGYPSDDIANVIVSQCQCNDPIASYTITGKEYLERYLVSPIYSMCMSDLILNLDALKS